GLELMAATFMRGFLLEVDVVSGTKGAVPPLFQDLSALSPSRSPMSLATSRAPLERTSMLFSLLSSRSFVIYNWI
ncbi:MAG: hypothetical protein KAJ42_03085, partial [Gemmatimonadetes bacterium]|nr:hypothetical protein [Gemmatimonadota bacterium]